MPLTKKQLRDALSFKMGTVIDRFATTGAGTSTTIISSDVSGHPPDEFVGAYALVLTGAESVKWREVTLYTSSSGQFTVVPALAGAPGSAVTVEIHGLRPDLYTLALNDAIKEVYGALQIPLRNWGGVLTQAGLYAYPVPRNFIDITRILYEIEGARVYYDTFVRANSTTTPGTSSSGHTYTISAGDTFGISSNLLYSESDTTGDLCIVDVNETDGSLEADLLGDLTPAAGTDYRTPDLVFRYNDSSNFLAVQLLNGVVDLYKVDGGTTTSLATATQTTSDNVYYKTRVEFIGTRIKVFVDEVEVLNHELIGPNYKYVGDDAIDDTYDQVGFRLQRAGTPTTNARWRRASFRKVGSVAERTDWKLAPDKRTVLFGQNSTGHQGFSDGRALIFEGYSYLTALADDATFGTLTSDGTSTVELTLATRETDLLVAYARYFLYKRLSSPFLTRYMEAQDKFAQLAQEALQEALLTKNRARLRQPIAGLKRLGWS